MTAGDKKVNIVMDTGGYVIPSGSTAVLFAWPGRLISGEPLTLSPVTIPGNGLFPSYQTTGMDITTGGPWNFQLQVAEPSGAVNTSPAAQVYINPLKNNG